MKNLPMSDCSMLNSYSLLILLPLRTIYFWTFQCETPCTVKSKEGEEGRRRTIDTKAILRPYEINQDLSFYSIPNPFSISSA